MKVKFFLCLLLCGFTAFGQQPYELLITEIMADPTPARGVPEKEYVEIYNASARPIKISEYTLQYGNFETTLPDSTLAPKSYAVLVRKGNEEGFLTKFRVFPVAKLSLSNGGELLRLVKLGNTVHEVNYSSTWYAKGRDQGYSLEMIDLNFPCVGSTNWTSSKATFGGSPATVNASAATNPDVTPPELLFSESTNASTLSLTFSEKLDTNAVKTTANYRFSPEVTVSKILVGGDSKEVTVLLKNPLPANELVNVTLRNVADCSGNVTGELNFTVGTIAPADSGSVVLNEVLFNPKTGSGDYLELYNRSDKVVSLKNWSFANAKIDGSLDKTEPISKNNLLMAPQSYLVFTENVDFLRSFYPGFAEEAARTLPKLPTYPNTDGSIILMNDSGQVFDRFDYNETMHHPTIDNVDGVALEKRDVNVRSNTADNWQSAAAETGFGTPGYENSQRMLDEPADEVTVSPEVFTPDGDGFNDFTELSYNFVKAGNVANVQVFTAMGVPVTSIAQNQLLGTSGKMTWSGTGTNGNELAVGYYLIVFDVFNPDGFMQRFRKKVVLGRKD